MSARSFPARSVDAFGVGLSGLCLIHCLALPLFISVLPVAFQGLQSELVHQGLVLLAVPAALSAGWAARRSPFRWAIQGLLLVGAMGLALGAFAEPLHDQETLLTVAGAICLSLGHLLRWRAHISDH